MALSPNPRGKGSRLRLENHAIVDNPPSVLLSTRLGRFEAVYRQHYGFVVASALRLGVDRAHLDDAAQEVFLVAYRRWSDASAHVRPWLYAITRRVASNHRRRAFRATRKYDAAAAPASEARPAPRYETVLAIDSFLRTLPERDRELFVLAEIEGLTGLEVADVLRLKPSTAYARLKHLQTELHRQVDPAAIPASLARCRAQRRPATAQGWAALVPLLGAPAQVSAWASLGLCTALGLGGVTLGAAGWLPAEGAPDARLGTAARLPSPARSAAPSASSTPVREVATSSLQSDVAHDPRHTTDVARGGRPPGETARRPRPPSDVAHGPRPPSAPPPARSAPESPSPRMPDGDPATTHADSILARQTAQLREARRALEQHEPGRALERLAGAEEDWHDSPLTDARIALRIEAWCALGDAARARQEATAWARSRRSAAMSARLRASCVGSTLEDLEE